MINCVFSEPKQIEKIDGKFVSVDLGSKDRPGNYSLVDCTGDIGGSTSTLPAIYETITDPTSGKSFILDKSMSFGSALTNFLLLFLIVLLIANFLFKVVIKRN